MRLRDLDEDSMLRVGMLGLLVFVAGIGFGYWWCYQALSA